MTQKKNPKYFFKPPIKVIFDKSVFRSLFFLLFIITYMFYILMFTVHSTVYSHGVFDSAYMYKMQRIPKGWFG